MKRFYLFPFAFLAFVALAACTPEESGLPFPGQTEQPDTPGDDDREDIEDNENEENNMEDNKIRLSVGGRSFTATMVDNSSVKALLERLAEGEVSIRMNDYGDMEKVGSLGFSLPANDAYTTTGPGDLILYQGSSFVIYYDSNSWSFTRLGKVDGVSSRSEILELLGGKGEVTVTLSLE